MTALLAMEGAFAIAAVGLYGILTSRSPAGVLCAMQVLWGGAALAVVSAARALEPERLADPAGPHVLALAAIVALAAHGAVGFSLAAAARRRRVPLRDRRD